MEKNSTYAVKLSLRYIISAFVTFFVYISVFAIFTAIFVHSLGYTATDAKTGEELYVHYFADGEDMQKAEYEAKEIDVSTGNTIAAKLSGKLLVIAETSVQIIGILVTLAFVYNVLWRLGDSDENLVNFSHRQLDMMRGFKIGALATIPYAVAFLIAVLGKSGVISSSFIALYRFMNFQYFTLGNLFFGRALTDYTLVSWGGLIASASIMLILPILSGVCYIMGYKHIVIKDRIIYKNKKETK